MTTKYSSRLWESPRPLTVMILSAVIILASWVSAQDTAVSERFMSRSVRNISPEQAIRYVAQTNLGTASQIPNTQTILITAETSVLAKARVLLELVDSKEQYTVVLMPANQNLIYAIQQEKVAEQLTGLSLVTFAALPAADEKPRVLVDLLDDSVIVAAPADCLEQVLSALERISEPQAVAEPAERAVAEPNQPVMTEVLPADRFPVAEVNKLKDDQFFNRVLDSLAEAEQVEAALKGAKPQVPEPSVEAREVEAAGVQQEPVVPPAQEPQPESDLTKIIELTPKDTNSAIKRFTYEPAPTELADEQLELDLPETINVVELIDLVGKYLNLNLLYDPKEVTGQVTLRVQGKIKVGELYPLLESVLKFRGFAMTRKDNLVTIVPINKVLETDPVLFDTEEKRVQFGNVIVTRVFDLRYIDTDSAENLLKEMKLGAHIKGVPDAGKLIVTDYAYRMGRVEELLTIIDRPGEVKQFRYRQLRYTMARSLASQVETLAEQLGTITISVAAPTEPTPAPDRRGRRVQPRPAPQPTPTPSAQPEVYLDADERTNRILMIGMPEQLDIVEMLIDSLDVAQQDLRTLRLYDIQYAGADEVVEKLQALGIISGGRRTTTPTGRITAPKEGQPAQGAPATVLTEEGLVEEPQVVIIESTNSLLVNATAEQHAQIATIIAYVDAEPQQSATNYVVYPLENQDPEILAGVLKQLIQETIEEQGAEDSKVVRTRRRRIEEDITIIAEPTTYSLVVYAGKKHQQWLSTLIEQLDEYRPQVLLDVTLVEITQNDKFEYDLDIISKTYGGRTLQSGSPVSTIDGSDFSNARLGDFSLTTSDSDSIIRAFLNASKVQALITAIEEEGYGRVMAKPKILVNDNQEGAIKTENTISVPQVKSIVTVPDTGSPYTTTDVSFTDYIAGVALIIKPHISKGDMLRLEITLNRTDFGEIRTLSTGGQEYTIPPDRLSTDVTTVSTVPNGTTIILGGLETVNQSKSQSKVPLLGDVPLVGGLFRGVADSGEQSRLYVFVKANIIRPSDQVAGIEDIRRVSQKNRQAFEEMEQKFQKLQDWPGIDPKPMDPIRVLDDD
jgi:general secretion pathway protein D